MGANTSALLSEEIEEMSRETKLSQPQIKRLYQRFQELDRAQVATLDLQNLLMLPELAMNPLHPRLLSIFHNINFRQFVRHIAACSPTATPAQKLDFVFRIYDVDADGFISKTDLAHVLRMLVGPHVSEDVLLPLVDRVFDLVNTERHDKISPQEFADSVDVITMASKLSVSF